MENRSKPTDKAALVSDLRNLGIAEGDLLMVHASLKAIGPVDGGPQTVLDALLEAIGPTGTLLAFVSWDHSPYDETLNGRTLSPKERAEWPAFDPQAAGPYPGFGALNGFIAKHPGAHRSLHPDASMAAIGQLAPMLVAGHELGCAFGVGSPLERFVAAAGRVLLLGAPLDAVTVLHYAEAVARIPGKRRVRYEMPVRAADGSKVWIAAEDFDSNGILDCYTVPGQPDAVEQIARSYVSDKRHRFGSVGQADCHLFAASDLVRYGIAWLESRHGRI
jgi:aminoglycoside 3-N-acetyltransferase/aminoglycoside 3-N-acetyltransferase-2